MTTAESLPASMPVEAAPIDFVVSRVEAIRTMAEFETLHQSWDDFLKDSGIENLCLTHGWLSQWLRHFPAKELLILIAQNAQGEWLAVAPLKISLGTHGLAHKALRHLQFIGTQPTVFDWMQFVIRPGVDEQTVMRALVSPIQKARWDVLDLQFLPNQNQARQLAEALGFAATDAELFSETSMPHLALPETKAAYEAVRRKKTRLEVNRHVNRFIKESGQPPELQFLPACGATNASLARFAEGHIAYWASRGQKSDFQRFPALNGFYRDMLAYSDTQVAEDAPKLLFSVLKLKDVELSYHLGFWQGSRYLSHLTNYNSDFKTYSPGTIHMDSLVFDTLQRGGTAFEFGRGDEPYKKMWSKEKLPLWNLRLFRHPWAKLLWNFDLILKRIIGKAST